MATGTLLDALSNSQYGVADDPYATAGLSISKMLPSLVNPYGSVGGNLAGVIGGGLLAALLGGYGKSEIAADNTALQPLQEQYLSGDSAARQALLQGNPDYAGKLSALEPMILNAALTQQDKKPLPLSQGVQDAYTKAGFTGVVSPDDANAIDKLLTAQKKKGEDKLSQATVAQINDKLKAAAQINAAKDAVDNMGGDNLATAIWRNVTEGYDPNSDLSSYRRTLPALADQLAKGYAGTGRQYTIQQMQKSLDAVPGETSDKVKEALDTHSVNLISDAMGQVKKLQAAGYDTTDLEKYLMGVQSGSIKDNSFMQALPSAPGASSAYKASDLIAQGYVKTAQGWVKP